MNMPKEYSIGINEAAKRIKRAKREVLADVAAGLVPATCASFSELHDYVDANGYGGAFEDGAPYSGWEGWSMVQDAVDTWIKSGGLR